MGQVEEMQEIFRPPVEEEGSQRHMPPFSLERKLQQAGRLNCLLATEKVQDQEREPCPLPYGWVWRRIGAPLGSGAPTPLVAAAVKLCHSAEGHSKLRDTVSIQHTTEQVKGRLGSSPEQAHSQPLARKCRTLQPVWPPAPPHKTQNSRDLRFSLKDGSSHRAQVMSASFLCLPRVQHCLWPEEPGQDC